MLVDPTRVLEDAGVLVEGGRVRRVLGSRGAVRRAAAGGASLVEGGDGVLAPGMVNAHAHLELSGFGGKVPPGRDFPAWIEGLLRLRGERSTRRRRSDATRSARALLASGTTCVGDVDSTGAAEEALVRTGIRAVLYREVLDPLGAEQREASLARVRRALPRRVRVREGLSPHAPMTCSAELLRDAARLARRRRLPVAVHWAESAEEAAWMEAGAGPFRRLLGTSPGRSGLEHLSRAGLLGRRTALIHANHPARGEAARAAARVAAVVHCPGAHRFFGREPFPLSLWRRAGATLALGTDSLAGNTLLDLRHELAVLRQEHPGLSPATALSMATLGGARALGLEREVGSLRPGRWADMALHGPAPARRQAVLELLTAGRTTVSGVWVAGRRVPGAAALPWDQGEPPVD